MLKNKAILLVFSVLLLNACSTSGMFKDKNEKPKLEGERISVLELQKTLSPDANLKDGEKIIIPTNWANKSWPQAGGYPSHVMQNPTLSNAKLKRVWATSIGAGSTGNIPLTTQPIIVKDVIYALDTKSRLSAFNALNGKKIWKIDIKKKGEGDNVIGGGLSFAHDTIYATNGYDEVLAIAPQAGEIKWRKALPAPSRAAPTVIGGRVFISTINSRLVTLSAQNGASLWEYTGISEMAGLLGAASPAANNEIVVPVFSSGEVTALRVENGSVAWSDNLSNIRRYGGGLESISDIKAMPLIDKNTIIALSFGGKLVAIDERSGTRKWQKDISGSQTPWIAGNHIYVLSSDNQVIALNVITGSIIWIKELARFEDEKNRNNPISWGGPIMASGELILTGSHGYIAKLDAVSGKVTQMLKTKKNIQISPIIANDTLYLLSEDGTLMAYR